LLSNTCARFGPPPCGRCPPPPPPCGRLRDLLLDVPCLIFYLLSNALIHLRVHLHRIPQCMDKIHACPTQAVRCSCISSVNPSRLVFVIDVSVTARAESDQESGARVFLLIPIRHSTTRGFP